MGTITQRAFSRSHHKGPILFSNGKKYEYHKAIMVNSGVGGMCFESHYPLNPGDSIFIKMLDMMPDPYWPEARDRYFAEVRWCQEKKKNETVCYGVGVRFIAGTCTHCGSQLKHRNETQAELCPDCRSQFCTIPGGKMEGCIEKYLIGNVL